MSPCIVITGAAARAGGARWTGEEPGMGGNFGAATGAGADTRSGSGGGAITGA